MRVLDLLRGVVDVAVFRHLDIAQLLGWRTIRQGTPSEHGALQRNDRVELAFSYRAFAY